MSWIYKFERFDPEISKDTSTSGRWTFNRYLYYEPSQYYNWSKGNNIQSIPYSAELINASQIPAPSTHLSGALSAFYLNDVINISNLNAQDNPQATSYAVVTLQYQNKQSNGSDNSSIANANASINSNPDQTQPWKNKVQDFTITPIENQIPFEYYWENGIPGGTLKRVQTTAGQPILGLTTNLYTYKVSWTYNTHSDEDYFLNYPIVNNTDVNLPNGITVLSGNGLQFPPTKRILYYHKNSSKKVRTHDMYYQWTFEFLIDDARGFNVRIFNAGTKCLDELNKISDICTWYVVDPNDSNPPQKHYGTIDDMCAAKNAVKYYNKSITDENLKKTFSGDLVNDQIPLTNNGRIDTSAIEGGEKIVLEFPKYRRGTWKWGYR